MSYIYFPLPDNIAYMLSSTPTQGDPVDFSSAHITAVYFGDSDEIDPGKVTKICQEVARETKPIACSFDHIESFPAGEAGYPIICPILGQDILAFRARLVARLEEAGVPFDKKFPEYRPHTTLAYADKGLKPTPITKVSWQQCSLAFDLNVESTDTLLQRSFFYFNANMRVASRYIRNHHGFRGNLFQ